MSLTEPPTSCDDLLDSPAPEVTNVEALQVAEQYFGISGQAHNLASERDTNFHIVSEQGFNYALKFANPAEPPQITNFQTEALRYLERNAPQLPVPRVTATRTGANELSLSLVDGRQSVVRMLTWVMGTQVARVPITPALRRSIGITLAHLGAGLREFDHPASDHYILWDIKNAVNLHDMIPAVKEESLRRKIKSELTHFEAEVAPRLPTLRQQVIHNDLNHYNVVTDPGIPDRVSGVLDFGDMVKTATVIDLAVAASYFTNHDGAPLDCVADVVAAYHSITPLTNDELELMRDLIVTRLITSVVITNWRAEQYPENATYILRNNRPARDGIDRFARLSRTDITNHLMRACQPRSVGSKK